MNNETATITDILRMVMQGQTVNKKNEIFYKKFIQPYIILTTANRWLNLSEVDQQKVRRLCVERFMRAGEQNPEMMATAITELIDDYGKGIVIEADTDQQEIPSPVGVKGRPAIIEGE